MTTYWLDPNWTGTKSGTQAQPWSTLSWSTINSALASDDVTVYFSARIAASDTAENYGGGISVTSKTADPEHTLTLDGHSYYNTNETTPSWSIYAGSNRCIIQSCISQNSSHTKYSDFQCCGFKVYQTSSDKGVSICGDHWLVDDCDVSHGPSVSSAPLFLLVPTADDAHEGSSSYAPACTDITISHNTIHDSYGEALYVGGGGTNPGEAGSGYPSHTYVTIHGNTFTDPGSRGGEGDAIDVKGGLEHLTISNNDISGVDNTGARAIVMQGQESGGANQYVVVEKNYIHDCPSTTQVISLSNSWGDAKGVTIRNNLIDTCDGDGITVYSGAATDINIYNNTFYTCSGFGVATQSGNTCVIKNNAFLNNNSNGQQVSLSGTVTVANNAYSGSWNGGGTGNVSGLSASDFGDPTNGDFTVASGSTKLRDTGADLSATGFSDDYAGNSRPAGYWDIGAYEYQSGATTVTVGLLTSEGIVWGPTVSAQENESIAFWQSIRMRY